MKKKIDVPKDNLEYMLEKEREDLKKLLLTAIATYPIQKCYDAVDYVKEVWRKYTK